MKSNRTFVLPLADIKVSLKSRIAMVAGYKRLAERAVKSSRTSATRAHNRTEVRRLNQKMRQLQAALADVQDACCPNPMDCDHQLLTD